MNKISIIKRLLSLAQLCILLTLVSGTNAFAQADFAGEDSCTTTPFFDFDENPVNQAQDMLQAVVNEINTAIQDASERLFLAFTQSAAYQQAIFGAFALVLIFFATSFMFGFVTLTLMQTLMRLIKISIVVWIASPAGLTLLNDYFAYFFNEGSAWLINAMISIASTGVVGTPGTDVSRPFSILDGIIQIVFSPRMFVTIIGTFAAGPLGFVMGGALVWAVIELFLAVLKAVQIYVVALVIKAVLLGLAPVMLPMMLFERTKQMFMGWINQLVNFSLQPILLFAFLAFFAVLVESAARDMLPRDDVHLCYVKAENQAATPFDSQNWRFMCCDNGTCQPYEGRFTWEGMIDCETAPEFPLNHVNILVFLLLTHIMKQLADVAVQLGAEISQGLLTLDRLNNPMNQWFGGADGNVRRGSGINPALIK